MMKRALVVLLLSISASAATASCLDPAVKPGDSTQIVELPHPSGKALYYFHSFDFSHMLFVEPDHLAKLLRDGAARDRNLAELSPLIEKDLPLTAATDLFRYVLTDPYQAGTIQHLLAELFARREVAIYDMDDGRFVASVKVKIVNRKTMLSRTFYVDGSLVFFSFDCIVD